MTQMLETPFGLQVLDAARETGYKVTLEPTRIPNQKFWPDGLVSWVRGRKFRPDILVEHGKRMAIIETKSHPALLGSVIQAHQYGAHFDAASILCVPDDSFLLIPGSVREFAEQANVRLCPLSEVGDALKELLGSDSKGNSAGDRD